MPEIKQRLIEEEMKESYIDYSMSVIVGRALPDVRDGLKPVHRRILYSMHGMGLASNKPFVKSARIVGECFKYHPHGDVALYESLVRMAQDFSLMYPLVSGHGNFGSIDFQGPAQMRYCLTGDALVVTEKGLVRIDQISNNENINLRILSKDQKINTASKWFDSGKHPTLKIKTNRGYNLEGSFNHPILILTKNEFGKPKLIWKRLDQIKIGDTAVIDRTDNLLWPEKTELEKYHPIIKNKKRKVKTLPKYIDESLGHILGAIVSEGSVHENEIEFCNSDKKWIESFGKLWKKVFPDCRLHKFNRKPNSYGKKDYQTIEIHSRHVVEFLRNLGLKPVKSADKRVPEIIFTSPKIVVTEFLRSYFEGDGGLSQSTNMKELICCSRSEKLIEDIQILLLRVGIASTKRYDKYKNLYKLYIRGLKNYKLFKEKINFISKRKQIKLIKLIEGAKKEVSATDYVPYLSSYIRSFVNTGDSSRFIHKYNFDRYGNMKNNYGKVCQILIEKTNEDFKPLFEYLLKNNYLFETITSIEFSGVNRVYSIRVNSECHSFIANGFINHNTEAKLSKIAEEMLADIDKNTVDFIPNFDGSLKEPTVLPSKIPNLLMNGSSGIAVGMATNMPPHNIIEVIDAIIACINNPNITSEELLNYIKGPDFPTGAVILGKNGIKSAYTTGRGLIKIRAKTKVEQAGNKQKIIVEEIPYQINKALLIGGMADLIRDKVVEGISDIRDESDRNGIRVVIELKKEVNPELVLNQLYKHSQLETTFGVINIALVNNEPKLLTLKDLINYYILHRKDVVTKRTQFELNKARERIHILEGLIIALNNIDNVVKLIKSSKSVEIARNELINNFKLTELQANSILDIKLQRLTSLEQDKTKQEHIDLTKLKKELEDILSSGDRILNIIKDELIELKKYGKERKTIILEKYEMIEKEELIPEEENVIMLTHSGYIKRMPLEIKQQRRGGKGTTAAEVKEEDFVEDIFTASTRDNLLFFTNKGKVYWLKAHEIPEVSRHAKGKAIVNLLNLKDEKLNAVIPIKQFDDKHYLLFVTRDGIVKKTNLAEYSNPRKGGIAAINLHNDEVVDVKLTDGNSKIIIATKNGVAIKFDERDVRPMGRNASGVIGIELENDSVIGMDIADENKSLLTVTENGYGKRTLINEYRLIRRGGKGVINIITNERNGKVVGIKGVINEDDVMLITKKGILSRIPMKDVSVIGRNTQGVRLIRLEEGDKLVNLAKILE